MSDDRSSVSENNEKKLKKKNCQDNKESTVIGNVEVLENDRPRQLCYSLERNNFETTENTLVSSQQFCRFCRDIPEDLIDGTKRNFLSIENSRNFNVLQFKRSKDDNPDGERNEESTYSNSEPIYHARNIVGDRKRDKFILSEVVEDTGTRSKKIVNHQDEANGDKENDDNGNQELTSSTAMDEYSKSFSNEAQQLDEEAVAIDKGQEDNGSCDISNIEVPLKFRGSPELRRKFSRTDAVRDDARKLKTATLDRMGKIFKLKSGQTSGKESHEEATNSEAPKDSYGDQQSKKEKTNSLGRMFKLVDKNGEPRKLLPHSRTGSLSHILRRKSTGAQDDDSSGNRNNRSVFSRLFSQWKNRSGSGNATAEPNLRASIVEENKSPPTKPATTPGIILSSTCTNSLQFPTSPAAEISSLENDVEYPA